MPDIANIQSGASRPDHDSASTAADNKVASAIDFAYQAERLGQFTKEQELQRDISPTQAIVAKFITPQDPVVETANGGRLPAIPVEEAVKLNTLRASLDGHEPDLDVPVKCSTRKAKDGTTYGIEFGHNKRLSESSSRPGAPLRQSVPSSRTNPLFPPLPTFGPPKLMRTLQCWFFRATSAVLSFLFLLIVVLGAAFTSIPMLFRHLYLVVTFRDPRRKRPFYDEENRRRKARKEAEHSWTEKQKQEKEQKHQQKRRKSSTATKQPTRSPDVEKDETVAADKEFVPTEGGPDPLVCDVGYYARRVGLDVESFDVETEDGFIIELWHVFNPREYQQAPAQARKPHGPNLFRTTSADSSYGEAQRHFAPGDKRYPVLMIHGLLQSAGAYCCTDDDSLAFYLAKSGYDVWLGNNRCGFKPRHVLLEYDDPRMWAWNIRQMGVMDLPALVSRVLAETGFKKLGLVAHSQGTTQTLVALAKEQRPDIGDKISVFCALAPAAYAGPLIGKAYFKFMYIITPNMFRCIFGIHAFIPFMMEMHKVLPARLYGAMGYRVFSFLFNWTDTRWEKDLRNRLFQFSPVYVSSESMRWWLGRECFARQKCILATKEEGQMEDVEDEEEDDTVRSYYDGRQTDSEREPQDIEQQDNGEANGDGSGDHRVKERGQFAWYDKQFPPLAMWVCGADDLVDGRRLLRRFDRGREPHVNVVHKKIIEGYEHLDVIWAMDSIEKVGREVKEVIWKTASTEAREACRTPSGCEEIEEYQHPDQTSPDEQQHADKRDSSISTGLGKAYSDASEGPASPTQLDTTAGDWSRSLAQDDRDELETERKGSS